MSYIPIEFEIKCPDCNGDGFHEIGPECGMAASMCCGGCYKREQCTECIDGEVSLSFSSEDAAEILMAAVHGNLREAQDLINELHPEICHKQ